MNYTAVVFGPSGLTGIEMVRALINDPACTKVIGVSRKGIALSDPRFEQILVDDFASLIEMKHRFEASAYFCCIGTTIKKAGSKEAFRKVDYSIPVLIADLAEMLSVPERVIISSIGADPRSSNFYLRTKGDMEKSVAETYSGNLRIMRPSLLMGSRKEFRLGEKVAVLFMKIFGWMFLGPLKKYKGIHATTLAKAMIKATGFPGNKSVFESDGLQSIASGKT